MTLQAVSEICVNGFSTQRWRASCNIDSIIRGIIPFPYIISHTPSICTVDADYDGHWHEKLLIDITLVLKHSPSAISKRLQTGSVPASRAGSVSFRVIYLVLHMI